MSIEYSSVYQVSKYSSSPLVQTKFLLLKVISMDQASCQLSVRTYGALTVFSKYLNIVKLFYEPELQHEFAMKDLGEEK